MVNKRTPLGTILIYLCAILLTVIVLAASHMDVYFQHFHPGTINRIASEMVAKGAEFLSLCGYRN